MLGFRRAAVHLALIALLLRGFLPAGWMPTAQGDAPLVMCSVISDGVIASHDNANHDNSALPGKDDPRAHENCSFAAAPGIAPRDHMIFYTPVLQDGDLDDYDTTPVRLHPQPHAPQTPRAPPQSLI